MVVLVMIESSSLKSKDFGDRNNWWGGPEELWSVQAVKGCS